LKKGYMISMTSVVESVPPAVGAVLFAVCGVTGMSLNRLSRAIWPPFLVSLAVLAVVTYVP